MFSRELLGSLAIAGVAALQLVPGALGQDRMQLGAPLGAVEFQNAVGDRVFFSEGSAELGTRARAAIEAQAAWLMRHPGIPVTVEGHADEPGTTRHNLEVSRRRAQAVRTHLIARGVAAGRIAVVAYGRERLIAECASRICAPQNRRTVTVLGQPAAPAADDGRTAVPDWLSTRRLF